MLGSVKDPQGRTGTDESVQFGLLVSRVAVALKRHRSGAPLNQRDWAAITALSEELEQAADTIEFVRSSRGGRRPSGHLASVGATIRAVGAQRLTGDERSDLAEVLRQLAARVQCAVDPGAEPDPSLLEIFDVLASHLASEMGSPGDVVLTP